MWAFLGTLVGFLWDGIQVAYNVILVALQWSVKFLWTFATATYNILIKFARVTGRWIRAGWEATRSLYDHVLRPAWEKLWRFYDRVRRWIDRVFGPILQFLEKVRQRLLTFYNRFIRPILDAIGIARRVLRILETLGVDWARKLDAKLAELEERITRPFQLVLAKINEIVNLIDRVITFNGLVQRLALVRSIERDIRYVSRAFVNWRSNPTPDAEFNAIKRSLHTKSRAQLESEFAAHVSGRDGPRSGLIDEMVIHWTRAIERP